MIFRVDVVKNGKRVDDIIVSGRDIEHVANSDEFIELMENYDIDPDYLVFDSDGMAEYNNYEIVVVETDIDDIEDDAEYDYED